MTPFRTVTLSPLLAQLKAAPCGSRELDEGITAAFAGAIPERQSDGRMAYYRGGFWVSIGEIKPLTTSLDAALTLAQSADERREVLYHVADTCFHAKLDPAEHGARLVCVKIIERRNQS